MMIKDAARLTEKQHDLALKKLRRMVGRPRKHIAKELQIGESYLSYILSGKRPVPRWLAVRLGICKDRRTA
jgi:hypothetical protein